jgi:hypothetical protein
MLLVPFGRHVERRTTTRISQPLSLLKYPVKAKLLGRRIAQIMTVQWQLSFFSFHYFLSHLFKIHVRSTKNQGCPPIYFVFQLCSSFS